MTVKELIRELSQYDNSMDVVRVTDFESTDDNGLCKVEPIENVATQTYIDDLFGADNDDTVVMIY